MFVCFFFSFFFPFHFTVRSRKMDLFYETSSRGNPILVLDFNRYVRNRESKKRVFWRCTRYYQSAVNCPGSLAITKGDETHDISINTTRGHNEICEKKRKLAEYRFGLTPRKTSSDFVHMND